MIPYELISGSRRQIDPNTEGKKSQITHCDDMFILEKFGTRGFNSVLLLKLSRTETRAIFRRL